MVFMLLLYIAMLCLLAIGIPKICTAQNRRKINRYRSMDINSLEYTTFMLNDVIKTLRKTYHERIVMKTDSEIIEFGTTCKQSHYTQYKKRLFINDTEYEDFEDFMAAFNKLNNYKETVDVLSCNKLQKFTSKLDAYRSMNLSTASCKQYLTRKIIKKLNSRLFSGTAFISVIIRIDFQPIEIGRTATIWSDDKFDEPEIHFYIEETEYPDLDSFKMALNTLNGYKETIDVLKISKDL